MFRGWARCLRNMIVQVDRMICGDATRRDRAVQQGILSMMKLGIAPEA